MAHAGDYNMALLQGIISGRAYELTIQSDKYFSFH